jgi:uncharacterized protein involved in outer membrane biogenesis
LGYGPIDLLSGRASGEVRLAAHGYSPSAIAATLEGRLMLNVDDGVASGFDLYRLRQAVRQQDAGAMEADAAEALRSGSTGFDRLVLDATIDHGDLVLNAASLTGAAGEANLAGRLNLASQMVDARITLRPALPKAPEIALRLSGPFDQPRRTPELAGLARWMAEATH